MLADPDLPAWDIPQAARTSWHLTRESWPSLLGLNIVLGLMVIASLLMLCVGILFFGYPLMAAITGCAYAMIIEPATLPRQIA